MCKYAIIDLEMCKVPKSARTGKYHWSCETIQIGAVLLDEDLEIADEFVTYVSPEYGFIDSFIHELTGIRRADLHEAPDMKTALQSFVAWLPEDVKVVSWSETDALQIRHEVESKDIVIDRLDEILDNWIDCQKMFSEKMNSDKCFKLSDALIATDIIYKDGAHDGLVDAYNTALLFAKMLREPELVLNPVYKSAISGEEEECVYSMGSLFEGLDLKGSAIA